MKIKEKQKKTKRSTTLAWIVIGIVMLYLLMIVVTNFYFLTKGSSVPLLFNLNEMMRGIIQNTYFTPLNFVWDNIPLFEEGNTFLFYKIIIPPLVVMVISSLFINDYRKVKSRYKALERKVEEEKELHSMRKEAGMHSISSSATVDVIINNATDVDISWHNTWWGRIVIGVSIALILVILGLK